MSGFKTFCLLPIHLRLLRAMNVYRNMQRIEFGAPAIDPKRPYGSSDVYTSLAELMEITQPDREQDEDFTSEQYWLMNTVHEQTRIALEIVLATGLFQPGIYHRSKYGADWRWIEVIESQADHMVHGACVVCAARINPLEPHGQESICGGLLGQSSEYGCGTLCCGEHLHWVNDPDCGQNLCPACWSSLVEQTRINFMETSQS